MTPSPVLRIRLGRSLIAFLLLFELCGAPLHSQPAAGASSPPPAPLPQLLLECESGANYNACSLWTWHGSSYSAIWPMGAVAQLTVISADPQQVHIERLDTQGPLTGMTATYSGTWKNNAVSDGKIVATFKGGSNTLTWTASPTLTPVLPNPQMGYNYVNWYSAQLTAYAIFNSQGSFNASIGTEINDYRMRGEQPMNPGESRRFSDKYVVQPANYGKGVTYPQASVIAAIYSDGATFGDRGVLQAMVEERRLMLSALTSIGATYCAAGRQMSSLQDISSALARQQAAEDARSSVGKEERDLAYSFMQKSLDGSTDRNLERNQHLKVAVKRTWDQLNQLRTGLSDPVKDMSGNALMPPATPLTCEFP